MSEVRGWCSRRCAVKREERYDRFVSRLDRMRSDSVKLAKSQEDGMSETIIRADKHLTMVEALSLKTSHAAAIGA